LSEAKPDYKMIANLYIMRALNKMSKENRDRILEAYFGETGARYSLTRTHINSCDFFLGHYSYAPVAGDKTLNNFSIEEDRSDIMLGKKSTQLKISEKAIQTILIHKRNNKL
jgi:hypothetical protein